MPRRQVLGTAPRILIAPLHERLVAELLKAEAGELGSLFGGPGVACFAPVA